MTEHYYECLPKRRYQQGNYTLEAVQPEHIEKIRQWRNEQMDVLRQSNPISKDDQIQYYENHIWSELKSDEPKNILLSYKFKDELIGYGGLVNISWENLRGEISFLLKTDVANTKKDYDEYFPNFLILIQNIAFGELSLYRIFGELFDLRPKYSKAFENSGFILDGVLKAHNIINGKPVDSIVYGLVNNEEKIHPSFNKNNPNVLITSISKKVPLIKSVVKSVSKINKSIKVFGGDSNNLCIGKYFVDEFRKMSKIDELPVEALIDFCKENKIGLIIPSRDGELEYFSSVKKQLQEEGISVNISDKENILSCLDKLKFSQLKGIHSIPASENIEDIVGNRIVVKERYGAGSKSIGINLTKNDALRHAEKLLNPIFQPFIAGEEISIDAYITFEGHLKGLIMRRRDLVIDGESQVTTTFIDDILENKLKKIISKLNLRGPVVLQAIIDGNNTPHLIECNPRFGGASTLSVKAGLDSFYWAMLESNGVNVSNYPFLKLKSSLKQIRHATDYYL